MKTLLFTLVMLCTSIGINAQSIKSIRINGQDQQQKYVSISEIDSITYDVDSQKQILWSDGMNKEIPLSEIESVSFEAFETKFSYVENVGDGLDAIYSKDGYVTLFGFKDIPDLSGNVVEERLLYIAKVNKSGVIDESDATTIVVDSTFFPVRIVGNEINVVLSKKDDNHFDCLYYNQDTDDWVELRNLEMTGLSYNTIATSHYRRALSTGGSTDFNLTNVIIALSALRNVNGVMTAERIGKVGPGVGLFGDAASAGGLDEIGLSIGVNLAGNWVGAVIAAVGYISSKYDKLKQRVFGKDIKITIEDIKQTERKSFTVSYSVDGLNERGIVHSGLFFSLVHINKMNKSVIILPTKNGYDEKSFTDMEAGTYLIDMTLISEEYPFLRYITKPTIEFCVYDLGLDRYEIQDNPSYSNGTVNFKMDIFLNGSDEGLGDIQQFGYYTRYSNSIPDYKQVTHLSTIFESTPLTYELPIEREGFFEENRNFNTFEAKATGYYIGAYVVLKNGNIVTIDEHEIEGLIYKQKPSITYQSAEILNVDGEPQYNGDGNYLFTWYTAKIKYVIKITGGFWIDNIQPVVYDEGSWSYNGGRTKVPGDGLYSVITSMSYDNNSNMNWSTGYCINLSDGSIIYSLNNLQFGGTPESPLVTLRDADSFEKYLRSLPFKSKRGPELRNVAVEELKR